MPYQYCCCLVGVYGIQQLINFSFLSCAEQLLDMHQNNHGPNQEAILFRSSFIDRALQMSKDGELRVTASGSTSVFYVVRNKMLRTHRFMNSLRQWTRTQVWTDVTIITTPTAD